MIPAPECPHGYPDSQVREIMGERYSEFLRWMNGQTMMLCNGLQFNHETREHEATECAPYGHGGIVYEWDVRRFLSGTDPNGVWD